MPSLPIGLCKNVYWPAEYFITTRDRCTFNAIPLSSPKTAPATNLIASTYLSAAVRRLRHHLMKTLRMLTNQTSNYGTKWSASLGHASSAESRTNYQQVSLTKCSHHQLPRPNYHKKPKPLKSYHWVYIPILMFYKYSERSGSVFTGEDWGAICSWPLEQCAHSRPRVDREGHNQTISVQLLYRPKLELGIVPWGYYAETWARTERGCY